MTVECLFLLRHNGRRNPSIHFPGHRPQEFKYLGWFVKYNHTSKRPALEYLIGMVAFKRKGIISFNSERL